MTDTRGTVAAVIDGVNVDAVAHAARACAGVSDLYSGRFGEIGSYLPGRRVGGVQVAPNSVTVQVRSRWGVPASDLLRQISAVIAPIIGARYVEVVVADVDDPPGDSPGEQPLALPAPRSALQEAPTLALEAAPIPATVPAATGDPDPLPGLVSDPLRPGSGPPSAPPSP
jgi:hypothetical protein